MSEDRERILSLEKEIKTQKKERKNQAIDIEEKLIMFQNRQIPF